MSAREQINQIGKILEPGEPPPPNLVSSLDIFKRTFGFYSERFLYLTALGLASSVFTSIVFGFLWYLAAFRVEDESYSQIFFGLTHGSLPVGVFAIGAAVTLILTFAFQLAFLYAHLAGQPSICSIIRKTLTRVCSYIGLCLLYIAIVTLGGIFLIVPGVLFALRYALAAAVFVNENESPAGAIRKSGHYMKGRTLEVMPRILALVPCAVIALYSALIFAIPETTREAPLPILVPLMALPLVIFGHFASTYLFVLYQELKFAPAVTTRPSRQQVSFGSAEESAANSQLRSTWALYKERSRVLLSIQIITHVAYLLPVLFSLWLFRVLFQIYDKMFPGAHDWLSLPSPPELAMMLIIFLLAFLVAIVLIANFYVSTLYGGLAMTFAVADKTAGIREAYSKARKRLLPYLLISLWRDFIIFLGSIFFIPGLFYRARYAFSPFIFALESKTGQEALRESSELTKAKPELFNKLFKIEFLKSFGVLKEIMSYVVPIFIFPPIIVLSSLVLAFFIGVFSLIWIPFAFYIENFSYVMIWLFIFIMAVTLFLSFCLIPTFLITYYFQLYKSANFSDEIKVVKS